jgi:hypothetical protein
LPTFASLWNEIGRKRGSRQQSSMRLQPAVATPAPLAGY